jgi:hypothetical protein
MSLSTALRDAREGRPSLILKSGETNQCIPIHGRQLCEKNHESPKTYACALRRCLSEPCKKHVSAERARKPVTLSIDAFGLPWVVVVLPYVPRARGALARADVLREARSAAAKLLERLVLTWNGCDPGDWKLGIASCDHPEGDVERKQGKTAWKPHHNFAFPTVAFHRRVPNSRKRLRFFATPEQLAELRQAWAALQNQVLLSLGEKPMRNSNVFWEFRKETGRKRHMARYFFRGFPWWPGRSQRVSYYGAFGCRVVQRLNEVAALGVSIPGPVACPVCGGPFVCYIGPDLPPRFRVVSTGDPSCTS